MDISALSIKIQKANNVCAVWFFDAYFNDMKHNAAI